MGTNERFKDTIAEAMAASQVDFVVYWRLDGATICCSAAHDRMMIIAGLIFAGVRYIDVSNDYIFVKDVKNGRDFRFYLS